MRLLSVVLLALSLTGLSGCGQGGPTLVPVKGTVTYHGNAVPNASISIIPPNGAIGSGTTNAEGKFSIEPGVVTGKAKVMISATEMVGDIGPNDGTPEAAARISQLVNAGKIKFKSAVPKVYGSAETTTLTVDVSDDPAKNEFQLDLLD